MLKILQNRDEVVDLIHDLSERSELSAFKVGVAGSYVTGLNKKASPIDIVLKLKEGEDDALIGSFDITYCIHNFMEDVYSNKIQIIWLDLLATDEEMLLNYMKSNGIEANPESAYTNVIEVVRWVDEDSGDDEDRISSSVMTWDESENEDEGEDE